VIWFAPEQLFGAMKRTGILLWLGTVLGASFFHIILASKWRMLLNAAGHRTTRAETLRAHCAGLFANMWLPSIVGGDVVRIGLVTPGGRGLAATVTGILADRTTDIAALIVLAVGGLMFMPAARVGVEARILTAASIGLILTILGMIVTIRSVNVDNLPVRLAHAVGSLKDAINAVLSRKGPAIIGLMISLCVQGLFILQNILIGNAIGIHVPAAAWFLAWPLAKIVTLLPVSIGGLGLREGVLVAMFIPFSIPPTLSVAESLVWQTVMYAVGFVGGIISLWIGNFGFLPNQEPAASPAPAAIDGSLVR